MIATSQMHLSMHEEWPLTDTQDAIKCSVVADISSRVSSRFPSHWTVCHKRHTDSSFASSEPSACAVWNSLHSTGCCSRERTARGRLQEAWSRRQQCQQRRPARQQTTPLSTDHHVTSALWCTYSKQPSNWETFMCSFSIVQADSKSMRTFRLERLTVNIFILQDFANKHNHKALS